MNVLLLLVDSLNRYHLEPYGGTAARTPNLAAFARRGVTMRNHYAGSLPCMPARREIAAGRQEFPWRGWGHTEVFDDLLADRARRAGAVTAMVTDHYHLFEHASHGYFESFDFFEFIRGHENDHWRTDPVDPPAWVRAIDRYRPGLGTDYYRKVAHFRNAEDWFTPRVVSATCDWLRRNRAHPKWFLFVDHFEVHEPFHVPEPFRSLYTYDHNPAYNIWPPYQNQEQCARYFAETSAVELAYVRSQYLAKVKMVDHYLGRLFETLDDLQLWDTTMVIITTDHGHDLGEHRRRFGKQPPHHNSHARLPLLIWHPECAADGRALDAITATVDLSATVVDALGGAPADLVHSRSILPVLRGEVATRREATLCGTFGSGVFMATPEHSFVQGMVGGEGEHPLHWYSGYYPYRGAPRNGDAGLVGAGHFIPGVELPVWRLPRRGATGVEHHGTHLFPHQEDPLDAPDLAEARPDLVARLRQQMRRLLDEIGCPPEQLRRWGID